LLGAPVVFPWINETRFSVRAGDKGMTGNLYCGLHEYSEMAFVLQATRPDDLFVDVGANVGAYTLLACGVAGARGIAIEPVPSSFSKLMDNLRLNDLTGRVRALNVAAGAARGITRFTSDLDTTNHVVDGRSAGSSETEIDVQVYTLDELLDGARASIMKMDVEGYELHVIEGAHNTLRQADAIIVELNGSGNLYGHPDSHVVERLHNLGFAPYRYIPKERRLVSLDVAALGHPTNGIFVRDLDSIGKALARPLRYKVNGVEV